MAIFEDTNPKNLKDLLDQINKREAALPDFQRSFIWDPTATQELIVSIALNYPAGSLLRVRNTHDLFARRHFQGAPALDGYHPTYLVLDGQQRLTSLYQAFYGVGNHRYYLNLAKLLEGADFEDTIFNLRSNHKRTLRLEDFDVQAEELILPLSILKGGQGAYLEWMLEVSQKTSSTEQMAKLQSDLMRLHKEWILPLDNYAFPVVTLSDETGADAVCTIFETLNRTGVKLTPYELLTARFWPKGVNLRDLWREARAQHSIIRDFNVDPYYLLQVISLISRQTPSCKRSDVLALEADDIITWWDRAARGMADALEILRDDCGVLMPKWLPYTTMLNPMAAVLASADQASHKVGPTRQRLAQWFWCASLGQAYENASNSQSVVDLIEIKSWLAGGDAPKTVSGFGFDARILRETTARQRAIYRAGICLILRHGPRDFYKFAKITGDLITENSVDDHHVFPQGYLKKTYPLRHRDSVLNHTLIDRKTNIRISDHAPSEYMKLIRESYEADPDLGTGKFGELLKSHLLPADSDSPFWADDFEAFLDWRQETLWQEIQEATGVISISDDILEEFVDDDDDDWQYDEADEFDLSLQTD